MYKKLYFFFPFKGIGGVPIVFLDVAEKIAQITQYDVFIIDYKDGYMNSNLSEEKVKKIFYSPHEKITFDESSVVIFQSLPLWMIPESLRFNSRTKIIFWNLHPYNLTSYLLKFDKFHISFLKSFIIRFLKNFLMKSEVRTLELFDNHHSIAFMDGENLRQSSLLKKITNHLLIPIATSSPSRMSDGNKKAAVIRCVWIGRIVDFKYHILLYTLQRLDSYSIEHSVQIKFYIVGTGDHLPLLSKLAQKLSIEICFVDHIPQAEFPLFLDNIDIGFAMGKSALDIAKHNVPTILLDYSYKKIKKDYNYRWLYEISDYNLGEEVNSALFIKGNSSLEDMMFSLSNPTESDHGIYCMDFVLNNFNIDVVASRFVHFINRSSLYYCMIPNELHSIPFMLKTLGGHKAFQEHDA